MGWGSGNSKSKNLEGFHVIRHPYENHCIRHIAGIKKIDRPWVNVEWKDTGKSYKEHLLSGDGIAFEMKKSI